MTAESYDRRGLQRHVADLAERLGGQRALAGALGLSEVQVSRAATGVSILGTVIEALGLQLDAERARYVRVAPTRYVAGDETAALRAELAEARRQLRSFQVRLAAIERPRGRPR